MSEQKVSTEELESILGDVRSWKPKKEGDGRYVLSYKGQVAGLNIKVGLTPGFQHYIDVKDGDGETVYSHSDQLPFPLNTSLKPVLAKKTFYGIRRALREEKREDFETILDHVASWRPVLSDDGEFCKMVYTGNVAGLEVEVGKFMQYFTMGEWVSVRQDGKEIFSEESLNASSFSSRMFTKVDVDNNRRDQIRILLFAS